MDRSARTVLEVAGSSEATLPKRLAGRLLNIILPPRCIACTSLVDRTESLCGACWREIDFIEPPYCAACGWPFEYDHGVGVLCAACTARQPVYDRARAVMRYHDRSRKLVLAFKHADRLDVAPAFAAWMARAAGELLDGCGVLVPVPLHRFRLIARRYNQAALLCHAMARETGIPVGADVLQRTRATPSQAGLSRNERIKNVRGAFRVRPSRRPPVEGANVLLVDDVMTTGATVEACAKALRRAGAAQVDILTLARVVHPVHLSI